MCTMVMLAYVKHHSFTILIIVLICMPFCYTLHNNVCSTFDDYYVRDISPNCWYNPDVGSNVEDIVIRHGYSITKYNMTTEDGYIISMFRISKNHTSKGAVFLEHPATGAPGVWIDKGNSSLAFILSNEGYDVFLGCSRGSYYAQGHTSMSTESPEYWNFSFHEIGLYDLPLQLKVAHNLSNHQLIYIGHSMGVTSALVYASLKPHDAKKHIKLIISLAGVANINSATTSLKYLAPYENYIVILDRLLHITKIMPRSKKIKAVLSICYENPVLVKYCNYMLFPMMGFSPEQIKPEWTPLMFSTNPGGTSMKSLSHLGQIQNAKGHFQMYDYGIEQNLITYNQKKPKLYPVYNIDVPIYLMFGSNDIMSPENDNKILYKSLRKRIRAGFYKVEGFSHVDFLYGKTVREKVYEKIISIIK